MATLIDCRKHNYENFYTYTVSKDIDTDDEENSFQVDIDVRVNEWCSPETRWEPQDSGFDIDYDSFEIEFSNHSESEIKMINDWIELHKEKGTFEDAFGTSYFEIE